MTETNDDELSHGEAVSMLADLSPIDLLHSMIAAKAGLRVLQEIERRGVTPETLEIVRGELSYGIDVIERVARARGFTMPEMSSATFRSAGPTIQ